MPFDMPFRWTSVFAHKTANHLDTRAIPAPKSLAHKLFGNMGS